MTGYEEQWIAYHTDPDRPRVFDPDRPYDWDDGDYPPYNDDDIIYDEDLEDDRVDE